MSMDHLPNRGSTNVFVCNIPYNVPESELRTIFEQIGPVVDFRLVTENSRPKGYGFCQYEDPSTAARAIEELQGTKLEGRTLKLDHGANDTRYNRRNNNNYNNQNNSTNAYGTPSSSQQGIFAAAPYAPPPPPPVAPGVAVPPLGAPPAPPTGPTPAEQSTMNTIRATLSHVPPDQLLDVLTQMRAFTLANRDEAKGVLLDHPQLAYALFQAMLMMNIVNPAVLEQMAQGVAVEAQPPTAPAAVPTVPASTYPLPSPYAGYGHPPSIYDSVPPPPAAAAPAEPDLPEEQRVLLQQVLAMPQAEIDSMDPEQRATIMALRAQFVGRI